MRPRPSLLLLTNHTKFSTFSRKHPTLSASLTSERRLLLAGLLFPSRALWLEVPGNPVRAGSSKIKCICSLPDEASVGQSGFRYGLIQDIKNANRTQRLAMLLVSGSIPGICCFSWQLQDSPLGVARWFQQLQASHPSSTECGGISTFLHPHPRPVCLCFSLPLLRQSHGMS